MSGPPDDLLVFRQVREQVVEVRCQGRTLPLAPLELALLSNLAEASPGPRQREELADRLELSLDALYRLVYRLRRRIGERAVLQIGRSVCRRGRLVGFSGYQLNRPYRLEQVC